MLSIIVPTYNEKSNIEELAEKIFSNLNKANINGELIIVDDNSPDKTAEFAESLKNRYNIRVVCRKNEKGLSSAVVEGFKHATNDIIAFMDADLSHPPELLVKMFNEIKENNTDLVVGSRLVQGGGSADWSLIRRFVSFVARMLAKPITKVKDLTSGYFMMNKSVVENVKLNVSGFKIGLEIIVKGNYNKVTEVPFIFVGRTKGQSKLKPKQIIEYLFHVLSLYSYSFKKKLRRK